MKLTAEDYDPGCLDRSYAYPRGDPYPPPNKDMRAILACIPEIQEPAGDSEHLANNIASTLRELGVDPVKFGELIEPASAQHVPVPTPGDTAAEATFDADYQYEYEYEGDSATIELAAQSDTVFYEPRVGWRVTADAGTVSGTNGRFGSLNGTDSVKPLNVNEAVYTGDDPERPIIAGARFDTLPVSARIADELDDRLSEMWTITPSDANTELGSDPAVFPADLSDPVLSDSPIREPFAWDRDRLVMWYDTMDSDLFEPSPYQFENGMVVSRSGDPAYRNRDLPDSREDLIDQDGLERISPDTLVG